MKNTSYSRALTATALAITLSLSACSKSSEPAPTTDTVQDATTSTPSEATIVSSAPDSKQAVLNAAASFDRQLRAQASFGTNENPNDTDPRGPVLLLEAARMGDVWDRVTAGTALSNGQMRILMWQGAGQASVKWTRIWCPSGDCTSINSTDGTLLSTAGENSKLFNPDPHTSVCLQFHSGSQSAWLNISSMANTESVVSDVLETACPASVFPGITAATGTTYADLSATPGAALIDQNW